MLLTHSHFMLPGSVPLGKLRIAVLQDHIDIDLTVSTVRPEASTPVRVEHVCRLSLIPLDLNKQVHVKERSHRYATELCESRNDDVFASRRRPSLLMPCIGVPYKVILKQL